MDFNHWNLTVQNGIYLIFSYLFTPLKASLLLVHVGLSHTVARILMRVRKHEHITPILHSLHWLPVSTRIEYKVSLLTHQCIHGHAPPPQRTFQTTEHNTFPPLHSLK
ncbi:hypothetical protein UPYG_G00080710, partial [Umbra pygmaea]